MSWKRIFASPQQGYFTLHKELFNGNLGVYKKASGLIYGPPALCVYLFRLTISSKN